MKRGILLLLLTYVPVQAKILRSIQQGLASRDASAGCWGQAQERLRDLLIDKPDDAQVLYDLGVSSYRTKQFEQAQNYFADAKAQNGIPLDLKKQALFNLGNALTQLQRYEQAAEAYNELLEIDPDNSQAQSNRDLAKQLHDLEEQQKQGEGKEGSQGGKSEEGEDSAGQDKDQKEKGEPSKDQSEKGQGSSGQNEQQKNEQDQQDTEGSKSQGQGTEDKKDQKGDNQEQRDTDGNKDQQGSDDPSGQRDASDRARGEKQQQDSERDQKQQNHQRDLDQDAKEEANRQQDQQGGDESDKHDASRDGTGQSQKTVNNPQEQGTRPEGRSQAVRAEKIDASQIAVEDEELEDADAPENQDPEVAHLLKAQQMADEMQNKRLIRNIVRKNAAGNRGKQCW